MNTIDIITKELDQKGVSPSAMMRDLGFSNGLFSQWKNGLQKPSSAKLEKIAEYLNCSVDYLLTGENKKIPSGITEEDWELFDLIKQVPPELYESSKAFLQALVAKKSDQE